MQKQKGEVVMLRNLASSFCVGLFFVVQSVQAQTTFTRITDTSNPIMSDAPPPGYSGCSWIDYDSDGWQDLFITPNRVYRNLGNGNFVRVPTIIGLTQTSTQASGLFSCASSWADYNNDGKPDVFVVNQTAFLYRNDGGGNFTRILSGPLADSIGNRGWSCAWGDYDQDGNVDLVISHAAGFFPPGATPNVVLHNDGPPNYTFTKVDTGAIVSQGFQPYTVGSFVDYDLDGDLDFFIGSGPAGPTPAVDFMFQNMKTETGVAYFRRITTSPIATDLADGQNWNWVDIDNDGDLDGYRTNYGGGGGPVTMKQNDLYRNDGGTYVKVTSGSIVTEQFISLANLWGDFDNDGDLDCFVANEGPQRNSYYQNNGDGTFLSITSGDLVAAVANNHGAAAGDYDKDGDIDIMVIAPGTTGRALFRNDIPNSNKWVNIQCVGTTSDRAGIGTKVRAKATINGQTQWQIREVSTQNSFNGANMLNVHLGFGNATVIDSLEIRWERGLRQVFTNVAVNRFYRASEGQSTLDVLTDVATNTTSLPNEFTLEQNYPNPFNPTTEIRYQISVEDPTRRDVSYVSLKVFDLLGREVSTIVGQQQDAGTYSVNFDASTFASGVYFYRLTARSFTQTKRMLLVR